MRQGGLNPGWFLFLLLLVPVWGSAHLPALYGWEFLATDDKAESGRAGCGGGGALPVPVADPRDYHERIESLEQEQGAYGPDLVEWLGDLGRYHRERGNYDEAVRTFGRALHLVRIDHGLHSVHQLPLLDDLAQTYRLQGDLAGLDAMEHRRFTLLAGGDDQSPGREAIEATLEFLRWQREAHGLILDDGSERRLLESYLLNRRLLETLQADPLADAEAYRQLVFSQLSNLYLIMGDELLQLGSSSVGSSPELQPSQSGSRAYVRQRLSKIQDDGVDRGVELLEELLRLSGEEASLERARLQLELADWYQWNGDSHRAHRTYAGVERMLDSLDEPELLQLWLGGPVELPSSPAFRQFDSAGADFEAGSVSVRFHVTEKGLATNLQVLEASHSADEDRIKRMLVQTHFRPRFVGGRAVPADVEQREYRFFATAGEFAGECARGLAGVEG